MYFIFTHVVAFLETQCYQRYHLRVKFGVKNLSKITINKEKHWFWISQTIEYINFEFIWLLWMRNVFEKGRERRFLFKNYLNFWLTLVRAGCERQKTPRIIAKGRKYFSVPIAKKNEEIYINKILVILLAFTSQKGPFLERQNDVLSLPLPVPNWRHWEGSIPPSPYFGCQVLFSLDAFIPIPTYHLPLRLPHNLLINTTDAPPTNPKSKISQNRARNKPPSLIG